MEIEAPMQWYVAFTRPRSEKNVANRISRMGIESFLPTQKVIRQWSDRKKKIYAPLFPRYVFVKVTNHSRHYLFTVKDLVGFVSFENRPVVVKEREIEAIKMVLNEEIEICDFTHFDIGESVRICKGPLAGLEGIVIKQNSKIKLLIRIEYFQKAISVTIPTSYAEVIGVDNMNIPKH